LFLTRGGELSEPLEARGGGAPRGVAGVGPRHANKEMLTNRSTQPVAD
jgi:hypothetical protein